MEYTIRPQKVSSTSRAGVKKGRLAEKVKQIYYWIVNLYICQKIVDGSLQVNLAKCMTFGEKLWKHVVMKDSDSKQIMIFMTKSKKSQVCISLKLRICTVASWTISLWDYVSKLHRQIHPPKTGIEPTPWEAKWLRIGHYNPSANGAPDRIYIY